MHKKFDTKITEVLIIFTFHIEDAKIKLDDGVDINNIRHVFRVPRDRPEKFGRLNAIFFEINSVITLRRYKCF